MYWELLHQSHLALLLCSALVGRHVVVAARFCCTALDCACKASAEAAYDKNLPLQPFRPNHYRKCPDVEESWKPQLVHHVEFIISCTLFGLFEMFCFAEETV